MKIIEALKKIKHLDRKIERTLERVEELRRMIQQIEDWSAEKINLRHRLHKTNLEVTLQYEGGEVNIDQLLLIQALATPLSKRVNKCFRRQHLTIYATDREHCKVVMQYDPKQVAKDMDADEDDALKLNALLDRLSIETDVVD